MQLINDPERDAQPQPRPNVRARLLAMAGSVDPADLLPFRPPAISPSTTMSSSAPLCVPGDADLAPPEPAGRPEPPVARVDGPPRTEPSPMSATPPPWAPALGPIDRVPKLLRYALDSSPRRFVMRVCRFVLCTSGPGNHEYAGFLMRRTDLPALFPGHGLTPDGADALLNELWKRAEKHARVRDRNTLPLFLVTPQVAERVPPSELVTRRQNLEHVELAFLLRTVTLKVVDAMADGEPGAVLARKYFLSPGYRGAFRRRTGRRLNADKLAAATGLLVRHGFVAKENWRTRGRGSSRFDATRYSLGLAPLLLPRVFSEKAGLS